MIFFYGCHLRFSLLYQYMLQSQLHLIHPPWSFTFPAQPYFPYKLFFPIKSFLFSLFGYSLASSAILNMTKSRSSQHFWSSEIGSLLLSYRHETLHMFLNHVKLIQFFWKVLVISIFTVYFSHDIMTHKASTNILSLNI